MLTTLKEFMSLTEAARQLGVSLTTARSRTDAGLIRSVRDPMGRRLLLREDVESMRQGKTSDRDRA